MIDLPVTANGNKYVQNFLTKWPWVVFQIPDQKTVRIVDIVTFDEDMG